MPVRNVTAAELEPVRVYLRCTLGQAHRVHEASEVLRRGGFEV